MHMKDDTTDRRFSCKVIGRLTLMRGFERADHSKSLLLAPTDWSLGIFFSFMNPPPPHVKVNRRGPYKT